MDLKEAGCEDVEWTHLPQDIFPCGALENIIMHLQVPLTMKNFFMNLTATSYSPTILFHRVRFPLPSRQMWNSKIKDSNPVRGSKDQNEFPWLPHML
jgi:hypothetical protein